jgi:hypothetical protein
MIEVKDKIKMPKQKKRKVPYKLLVIALLVVALFVAGLLVYRSRNTKTNTNPTTTQTPSDTQKIDYNPPTAEQKQDSESHKDQIVQETQQPTTGGRTVTPIITHTQQNSDGSIAVDAFVPGIVENGGTCTLTATQGSQKVSATSSAFANATTTNCTSFSVPRSNFPSSGTWTFTVSYQSAAAQGMSQSTTQEVK